MSTRTVSALIGLGLAVCAIALETAGISKVSSQTLILSAMAASGIYANGVRSRSLGKSSYLGGCVVAVVLHVLLLRYVFLPMLPLPSTAGVFLLGAVEATLLLFVVLLISQRLENVARKDP